jgi:hypothetical protein
MKDGSGSGDTYRALCVDALEGSSAGHPVRVASLEAVLRMKRIANRAKDRKVLPLIEAALRKSR